MSTPFLILGRTVLEIVVKPRTPEASWPVTAPELQDLVLTAGQSPRLHRRSRPLAVLACHVDDQGRGRDQSQPARGGARIGMLAPNSFTDDISPVRPEDTRRRRPFQARPWVSAAPFCSLPEHLAGFSNPALRGARTRELRIKRGFRLLGHGSIPQSCSAAVLWPPNPRPDPGRSGPQVFSSSRFSPAELIADTR